MQLKRIAGEGKAIKTGTSGMDIPLFEVEENKLLGNPANTDTIEMAESVNALS